MQIRIKHILVIKEMGICLRPQTRDSKVREGDAPGCQGDVDFHPILFGHLWYLWYLCTTKYRELYDGDI